MASLRTDTLFGVKGYVAVVTGGTSGLGYMICKVSTATALDHVNYSNYSINKIGSRYKWCQGIRRFLAK